MQCYGWNLLCICGHLTWRIALHCIAPWIAPMHSSLVGWPKQISYGYTIHIAIECVLQFNCKCVQSIAKKKLYLIIIMWNPVHWIFHSNAMWNCTASVLNYNAIAKNAILDKFGSTYYGSLWVALAPLTQDIPVNSSILTLLSCSFHSFHSRAVHCQYKG